MGDRIESLPLGERWFCDGFDLLPAPGGLVTLLCDMSQANTVLDALRERGMKATYTHLFVRAAALALDRNPGSHQQICNYRRMHPGQVDIGLSVAGQTSYAPVLVIPQAERRPLPELVPYMMEAVKATKLKEERDLAGMRRTGWIIPFGVLRRFILRLLMRSFWFRRRIAGTFQISCLNDVDQTIAGAAFYTGAILATGRVVDRVIAVNGAAVVRPTVWLTLSIDHKSLDGRRAAALLRSIRDILEGKELLAEASS